MLLEPVPDRHTHRHTDRLNFIMQDIDTISNDTFVYVLQREVDGYFAIEKMVLRPTKLQSYVM